MGWQEVSATLDKIVGIHTIYGISYGKGRLRIFVPQGRDTTGPLATTTIVEITGHVAEVFDTKRYKDGSISVGNIGYDPLIYIAEELGKQWGRQIEYHNFK